MNICLTILALPILACNLQERDHLMPLSCYLLHSFHYKVCKSSSMMYIINFHRTSLPSSQIWYFKGFFNLVVYMYPRIMRYYEKGGPFTASFGNSKVISSIRRLKSSKNFNMSKRGSTTIVTQGESEAIGESVKQAVVSFAAEEEVVEQKSDEIVDDESNANINWNPDTIEERDAMDELVFIVEA